MNGGKLDKKVESKAGRQRMQLSFVSCVASKGSRSGILSRMKKQSEQ